MYGTGKKKKVDLGSKGSFEEHPGALHRALGTPEGEKIPEKDLKTGVHHGRLGRMIATAKAMRSWNHSK